MTRARLGGIVAAGGLIWVGTLFFFDSQTRNLKAHTQALHTLGLLKEADATLTQDVLRARFGLLPSYDPLLRNLSKIKQLELGFWEEALAAYGDSREKLSDQTDAVSKALAAKETIVEEFKSRNAVLKNSL